MMIARMISRIRVPMPMYMPYLRGQPCLSPLSTPLELRRVPPDG